MSGSARQGYSVVLRRRQVVRELDRLPDPEYEKSGCRLARTDPRRQGLVRLRESIHRFWVGN